MTSDRAPGGEPEAVGGKRYELRSFADLLSIPRDKLGDCLQDLGCWALLQWGLQDRPIPNVKPVIDRFIWFDDGKTGLLSSIEMVERE